jgi:CubicO group peptidase (beta-lactamase class C family)
MSSTSFSFTSANATGRLTESYTKGRRIPFWFNEDNLDVFGGAGGIVSTAPDLLKWAKALLGITNATSVGIPHTVLQECMSPQSLVQRGSRGTYGFGWFQQNVLGTEVSLASVIHLDGNFMIDAAGLAYWWPPRSHVPDHPTSGS